MDPTSVNFNIDPNQQIPVLDSAVNKILNDIYKYLSNISDDIEESGRDTRDQLDTIAKGQKNSEQSSNARSKASQSNDRAIQRAISGISRSQDQASKASQSNDRAVQKALSGISKGQRNSLAAENRNRATDRALSGSNTKAVNNGLKSLKDGVLQGLNGLKNAILPHLLSHFKSQADLAKRMRQNFATREEKDKAQKMANSMQGTVEAKFGFKLDRSEINDYLISLQQMGKDLDTMGEERVAAFAALKKAGLSDEAALKAAMSASAETVNQLTDAATDPRARQLIIKQIESASEAELAMNGVDKVFGQIALSSQGMARSAGNAITDWDKAAQMAANNRRAVNGMTEEVDGAMLSIQRGIQTIGSEGQSLVEQANQYSTEQLRALSQSGDEATRQMANQMLQIKNMQANGANIGTNVRTSAQNKEAKRVNATNGTLNFEIQKMFGKLDNDVFGGAFGKMSNRIDEMFGDSEDIGSLVSKGFALVSKLLTSINLKTGTFGKILMGLGGAAAVVAIIANWDKIKPKLATIVEAIKPVLADVVRNIPGFLKDAVKMIGDLLPELWKGLKNTLSGLFSGGLFGGGGTGDTLKSAAGSVAGAVSGTDFSQSFKEMGSSLGNAFKSILDVIGQLLSSASPLIKGLIDGIGSILVSLMPGLSNIVHDITGTLNKVVDAIAPAIPGIIGAINNIVDAIVKLGVPIVTAIQDIAVTLIEAVRDIGVTLIEAVRDVLVAIAPAINDIAAAIRVLCEAIAPVVPTIVDTIKFIAETVLPPLVNKLLPKILDIVEKIIVDFLPKVLNLVEKVVVNILPPLLDIIKRAVDIILPPMMDILKMVAETILPPISEALSVVVKLVDRIVNLILDILEPPLKAVSEAISAIVGIVTSVADFVTDIVNTFHGLFNFFVSKIPDLLGWVSGIFDWAIKDIFPIIKNGFKLVFSVVKALKESLVAMITVALTPAMTVFNIISAGISKLKSFIEGKWGDGWNSSKELTSRFDSKISAIKAMGHGDTEESEAAYRELMDFLKDKDNGEELSDADQSKAWQLYNKYENMLSNNKSAGEIAIDKAADAWKEVGKNFDEVTSAVATAIDNGGPTKNEAVVEEAKQYLTGQKGNIAAENVLPPNTGSLLSEISKNVSSSTNTLKSIYDFFSNLNMHANGAASTSGPAIVGEAGREAVLPLEKPSLMKKIFSKMSFVDKGKIITAASDSSSSSGNSIADNAIAYARDQVGKPYSIYSDGFVCNTLVQSAFRSAGMKKFPSGTVSTHWNSSKLHKVSLSDAIPGMIGFSNKSDKTGFPQHMGIITTDGKWVNASGSAVNGNYKKGQFQATPTSKGVLEVPMNTKAKWGMVGAGFYDGMFDEATSKYIATKQIDSPDGITDNALPQGAESQQSTVKEMTPEEYSNLYSNMAESTDIIAEGARSKKDTQLETLQNLSRNAINTIVSQTNGQVRYDVSKSKANQKISSNDSQKDEIILAMKDVVKYLRDMASFVKKPTATAPARLPHA